MSNQLLRDRNEAKNRLINLHNEMMQVAEQYENMEGRLTALKADIATSLQAVDGVFDASDVPDIRALIAEPNDRIQNAVTVIAAL
ncbi:MAG: hypothetical protein KAT90_15300 [Gammaproteobacteria bacterium]|nr:hypothetical protein [Gammaproteobacteria bacterium]